MLPIDKIKTTKPVLAKKPGEASQSSRWYWVALALIIICAAVIRGRLSSMPLERDEGEYAYIAQLMLKGVLPYVSAYSMKLPGIYAVYAVILAVFDQTGTAIHVGLLIVNTATILVIFWLAKGLFEPLAAVAAAGAYAIMSMAMSVVGLSANAEHFVNLPALIGIILIARSSDERRKLAVIFAAALLLGLAFIIKQHGIFFAVFAAIYLFYSDLRQCPIRWKRAVVSQIVFTVGVVIPFALVCLVLWQAGVFEKFWFWTFVYARKYTAVVPLPLAIKLFQEQTVPMVGSAILIWGLAVLGLLDLIVSKCHRRYAVFVVGLLVFSFLAVCPGFYFRDHYFLLLLPIVAVLAGTGFAAFDNLLVGRKSNSRYQLVAVLAGLVVASFSLFQQRVYLFYNTPSKVCQLIYTGNPFPESLEIAEFIRANSRPDDTIAVIGSEPQIYFYSNRRAATTYIYVYPLMEVHDYAATMQKEMIQQIESAKPELMVFVNIHTSWLTRPGSVKLILKWFNSYCPEFYDLVGIVDISLTEQSLYRWNQQVAGYMPSSPCWVAVYKRKR